MKEFIRRRPFTAAMVMLIAWLVLSAPRRLQTTSPQTGSTFVTAELPQPVSDSARLKVAESYGKLPLSFEANRGQTDKRVQFFSRGKGYSLFLANTESVLTLPGPEESGRAGIESAGAMSGRPSRRSPVLRMKLLGANHNARAVGLEELSGKSNYFIGSDPKKWRTGVPNYRKVRFASVYPGVDLVYYGNQRQLEYDFIVSPGADPSGITLAFTGAERLEILPGGDLALQTGAGEVRWQKPVIYQDTDGVRRIVDGHYVRKNKKSIGFAVGSYDAQHPLIIDPVLVYSTYLGGSGQELGAGIAVDFSGNVYVTGQTSSIDFPTAGAIQAAPGGGADIFVTMLNPAGTALVFSTYLGGSDNDVASGIAVDSSGTAYVTGFTTSNDFPVVSSFQAALAGTSDVFVAKLDAGGSALVYSTYLGGSGSEIGFAIAVDSSNSAYVVGSTSSTDFPTASPFQAVKGGLGDAFVTKLNAAGSVLVYSTYLGGSGGDEALDVAVDSSGNAYIAGDTSSTNFPTASPIQAASGGSTDAFVAKLNAAGSALVYSTYLGGSDFEAAAGIAVDSGNVYVTGHTRSTNFPTASPIQTASAGGLDVFVTQLNTGGSALVFSTYLGGSLNEFARGIALDLLGNAYVTGTTSSIDFPTASPIQAVSGGGVDAFVTKLDPAGGTLVYSTYLGGSGSFDEGLAIAVDSSGSAYVTGDTNSTNFPAANPFQAASGGFFDAFVAKIGTAIPVLPPTIAKGFGASTILLGGNTSLTFTLNNPNSTPLTGVGFTDLMPAGMIVATPNGLTGSCGGTVTAVAGSSSVALSNGNIGASAGCSFSVTIVGTSLGAWTNTTGNVTSTEGGSGDRAAASLTVQSPFPNCHGQTISDLAHRYGGLRTAAVSLGFPSVKALQDSIRSRCGV